MKIKAVQLGTASYKLANFFISLGLWVSDRLGWGENRRFVTDNYPILLLEAVKSELTQQGFPDTELLNKLIAEVEAFLHTKRRGVKK